VRRPGTRSYKSISSPIFPILSSKGGVAELGGLNREIIGDEGHEALVGKAKYVVWDNSINEPIHLPKPSLQFCSHIDFWAKFDEWLSVISMG
jgi:hypothetical protein